MSTTLRTRSVRARRLLSAVLSLGLAATTLATVTPTPPADAATYPAPRRLLVLGGGIMAQTMTELTNQWVVATGGTASTPRTTTQSSAGTLVSWTTTTGPASIMFRVGGGEMCDRFGSYADWFSSSPQRILVQIDGTLPSACMLDGAGNQLVPGTTAFTTKLQADIRAAMDVANGTKVPMVFFANPPMQDPAKEALSAAVTTAVQAEGIHVPYVTLDAKTRQLLSSNTTAAGGTFVQTMACTINDTTVRGCVSGMINVRTTTPAPDGVNLCPKLNLFGTCDTSLYGGYSSGAYRMAKQMVLTAKATTLTELYKPDPRSAAGLKATFAKDVAGIAGMDYQRAIDLGNGQTLWLFQDVKLTGGQLIHNAALLGKPGSTAGSYTYTLKKGGTSTTPAPWIGGATCPTSGSLLGLNCTKPFQHWFWIMGGATDGLGNIRLMVAEMANDSGAYLSSTHPVATWIATANASTLAITSFTKAYDSSADLFGFTVTSDNTYSYLMANCYIQFMPQYFLGMAPCTSTMYVARVPKGQLTAAPQYLTTTGWSATKANLVDVSGLDPGRDGSDPMQVLYQPATATRAARWIAVTKGDDWWGTSIFIDVSPATYGTAPLAPGQGGWTTVQTIDHTPYLAGTPDLTNTYFASFGPVLDPDNNKLVVGLGRNRWDGAFDTNIYQPTFFNVDVPA